MFLGIDIGGTFIKTAILQDEQLSVFKSTETKAKDGVASVLLKIRSIIMDYFQQFPQIKAVGIGIPGVVDNYGNVLVAPNLPGWENIPLRKFLRNYIDVPFVIENDANAAAIAELYQGEGKNLASFIYITLGTGVGGAIIHNRKLFRGELGGAGEIGHTTVDYNSRKKTNYKYQHGTLESFIGKEAIIELAKEQIKSKKSKLNEVENFDVSDITKFAENGDEVCRKVLSTVGEILGKGLASVMNLLDISTVIVGGGIANAGDLIFESARKILRQSLLPTIANKFVLKQARFLNETGVRGAALLGKSLLYIE